MNVDALLKELGIPLSDKTDRTFNEWYQEEMYNRPIMVLSPGDDIFGTPTLVPGVIQDRIEKEGVQGFSILSAGGISDYRFDNFWEVITRL